jgi:hypothetical protein
MVWSVKYNKINIILIKWKKLVRWVPCILGDGALRKMTIELGLES